MEVPPGEFRAYLFDCDGTIADSMPLHLKAWRQALARWGGEFPEELFYAYAGRPAETIVELLNQHFGLKMPPRDVDRAREENYRRLLPDIQPVLEVKAYIEAGYGKVPMAVVSGSGRESVIATLTHLKLLDRFDTLVGAEDYEHGKPSPEPFLVAARRLGVEPKDCLVFEDAELGFQSAAAAGMACAKVL